jgi:glycosyltransferase involved in cell wall biosynthesis
VSRIAFFTPLAPVKSALADHAQGILPYLAEQLDITVVTSGTYTPSDLPRRADTKAQIPHITYREFQRTSSTYDLVVYQMGDEPTYHGYMLDALPRYPGVVLLNDLVMHHAIIGHTLRSGLTDEYIETMRYSYGEAGVRLAQRVISGEGDEVTWQYPLVETILDQSLAVAAFNRYMCDQIQLLRPDLPVRLIPYPFYLPPGFPPEYDGTSLRRELDLSERPVVASFGFFIPDKRLDLTMRAFKALLQTQPDAYYLLVGGSSPAYNLKAELRSQGLEGHVGLTGWQDPISFVKHMFVTDIAVHLRWPHIGGTPYTPIRLLGLGVPTIVSDIEPLAEIPAGAVVRVPPGVPDEQDRLTAAMEVLLTQPNRAQEMAALGRAYVHEYHDMQHIVKAYVSFFQWAVASRATLQDDVKSRRRLIESPEPIIGYNRLIGVLGEALAGIGLTSQDDRWLRPYAGIVSDLLGLGDTEEC